MSDTLVIIPTYNEKDNAEPIAKAVLAACSEADLLFVDDNSPGGAGQLADRLAAESPRIHVMHRPQKQGLGRAYLAGFRWALERPDYRFIMEMDADFSHDPKAVPQLRAAALWLDLARSGKMARDAIATWTMAQTFFDGGNSRAAREKANEYKTWIDALSPLGTARMAMGRQAGTTRLEMDLGLSGGAPSDRMPSP